MALPKRGSRRITVEGIKYLWRVSNEYYGGFTRVTLAIAAQHRPSTTLIVFFKRMHNKTQGENNEIETPVEPHEVEAWIRKALVGGWQPLEAGKPFEIRE